LVQTVDLMQLCPNVASSVYVWDMLVPQCNIFRSFAVFTDNELLTHGVRMLNNHRGSRFVDFLHLMIPSRNFFELPTTLTPTVFISWLQFDTALISYLLQADVLIVLTISFD
jgi:hypothetical protein